MPGNGAGQVGRIPTEDGVLRVIDENELLATHDPENMRDDEAFRSAVMSAWIDNRMTRDKTLLALSSGGIGVLLTLVSTVGVDSTFEAMCFALGFLGFIVVIVAILAIFYRNPQHLENVLENPEHRDRILDTLDRVAIAFFGLAIIAATTIGAINGVQAYKQIETQGMGKNIESGRAGAGISMLDVQLSRARGLHAQQRGRYHGKDQRGCHHDDLDLLSDIKTRVI